MAKIKKEKKGPLIKVSPDLEMIYVSGGVGVAVDFDGVTIIPLMTMFKTGELRLTGEVPPTESVVKYLVALPPHAAKLLVDMLDRAVKEYEKSYGKIKMPPE